MKLLDLYEDLFQYLCLLNRLSEARPEAQPDYSRVRAEIKGMLGDIGRSAASDARLMTQANRLELPILFFVDNIICTSRLKFAQQWAESRLAKERKNELAGDERFFDFVKQDLADPSDEAIERLAIYCTCFGLGFTGMYVAQPDQLRSLIEQIYPRIKQWADSDRAKVSEEAYKHTDTRILTEPPSKKIVLLALCFIFFTLVVLALYYGLYVNASSQLTSAIQQIANNAKR